MKISIIGTGIYGVALALNIAENNHDILMWSENESLVHDFKINQNLEDITDVKIPNNIKLTDNIEEATKNADLIILVTASKYIRNVANSMKDYYKPSIPICIASKGIENDTCMFLSDVVKEVLNTKYLAVISGPTFARDLINKEPSALSLAGNNRKVITLVQKAFSNKYLKLRSNYDIWGTELCGSIKNVIAIAAGILEGLGYLESTRAFLITEALHDIKELLKKLECNPNTILSFAGIGDLILTCSSSKSRNYSFGKLLGAKASKNEIEEYLKNNTTEGYYTLLSIKELTKNRKINMPIISIIYDIAINDKNPEILSEFLMTKD